MAKNAAAGQDGVQAVQTAFRILDQLALTEGAVGVTELAEALGEVKSSVHRHLTTLKQLGAVHQDVTTGRYRLGSRLFALGQAAVEQFDLRSVALPYLTRLREQTHQTAMLAIPANGESVVVVSVEYRYRIAITSRPGNRPPPHCSSQGRVVLAFSPEAVVRAILARKLTAITEHSLTDPRLIRERLAAIRESFVEDADGEVMRGINGVAAPVFGADGALAGVIGIVGTTAEVPSPPPRKLVARLHVQAGALSAELGSRIYFERGLVD